MFAVETASGKYAVKALNPQVMLRPNARADILNGERIAAFAARFIPTLTAKQFESTVISEIDGQYYLVYDWVEGKPLYGDSITALHCEQIGHILGKIHATDFSPLNLPKPDAATEETVDWKGFLRKGQQAGSPWVDAFSRITDDLYGWNRRYLVAMKYLETPLVIGHGDIDPKNVLWHDGYPVIIDWESAGYLNPAHEFIIYALCWSDVGGRKDEARLTAFLKGYLKAAHFEKVDWRIVMDAGLSPHWLNYNLKRSLGIESADAAEKQLGTDQVFGSIDYFTHYESSIVQVTDWLAENMRF